MRVAVLGAGSWGTTLAALLASNGHDVRLWSYTADIVETIVRTRQNPDYLPGLILPESIRVTDDLHRAADGAEMFVLATPSQFLRSVAMRLKDIDPGNAIFVNVAKGIETVSLLRMSEVVGEVFPSVDPSRYAVLSGPSHAEEVAVQKATSVVVASLSQDTCQTVQSTFMTQTFRVYSSNDVVGVELGGSLKNVIAIGAGICDGGQLGDNTKAALITRGIAEMRRLGVALGARPETFAGLSGLGDLIVTTMSRHSRNRFVGHEIGTGRSLTDILSGMKMVAEGVETTRSAHALAERTGVEMPITHMMYRILFEAKDTAEATMELMTRQARDETW